MKIGYEAWRHFSNMCLGKNQKIPFPGSEIENMGVSSQSQIDVNDFLSSTAFHIFSSVCSLCWEQLWREDGVARFLAFQDAPWQLESLLAVGVDPEADWERGSLGGGEAGDKQQEEEEESKVEFAFDWKRGSLGLGGEAWDKQQVEDKVVVGPRPALRGEYWQSDHEDQIWATEDHETCFFCLKTKYWISLVNYGHLDSWASS